MNNNDYTSLTTRGATKLFDQLEKNLREMPTNDLNVYSFRNFIQIYDIINNCHLSLRSAFGNNDFEELNNQKTMIKKETNENLVKFIIEKVIQSSSESEPHS